jgi:multicomponent Na+:H+ antiporter subunit A
VTLALALIGLGLLAALTPALTSRLQRNAGYPLAAAFLLIAALLGTEVGPALRGEAETVQWEWLPALGVSFALRLDALALVFCMLILGVGALIMAYCASYLPSGQRHDRWYVLLTLFAFTMLGLVLSADIVLLFVFWELTSISSFFLIGATGPASSKPAQRALITTGAGGLALLIAVVLIAVEAGTTYLPDILANPDQILQSPIAWPAGALIIFAAMTKSAQLPFHSWLPGAMVAITPVSAYLHAATMVKAGIYLLMRFSPIYAGETAWQATLITVGLITAVVGAGLALRQHDLKGLLAYSTVSQLGLLVAVTGVGTTVGLAAVVVHTVAHALFKATLFMLVGIIDREAGSRDIRELGGLRRVMPVTATLTGLAGLSMAGVLPMLGFVSKENIFSALASVDIAPGAGAVAAGLGVAASALTFAYGIRIFYGAFAGPTTQRQLYEPSWRFLAPAAIPALLGLVLGPGVTVLNKLTQSAVEVMAPGADAPYLEFWHGFTIELLLTGVTISIGLTLFLARQPVDRFLNSIPLPPPGLIFDRGYDRLLDVGWVLGRTTRSSSPAAFLAWPLLVLVAVGGYALVTFGQWPAAAPGAVGPFDWPVLGLLLVAAVGVAIVRSGLVAVALLGVIGFVVSVWFMLAGAPDVALTLLLVEVLTAVVIVLVLRSRPKQFGKEPTRRKLPAAAIAVATGVLAMAGTLAFTGHRSRSPLADYFIANVGADTGGRNVVNTILVDYRALDTLGEAVVLGVAALGAIMLLGNFRSSGPPTDASPYQSAAQSGVRQPSINNSMIFQVTMWVLAPGMLLLSAYLFFRGHYEPGGGFIAGLVAGVAVTFGYIAQGRTGGTVPLLRLLKPEPLVGIGLLVSAVVGLAPVFGGEPFLTPLHLDLGFIKLSSSLGFDVGIYLFVLGTVVAAVDRLGASLTAPPAAGARRDSASLDPVSHGPGGAR